MDDQPTDPVPFVSQVDGPLDDSTLAHVLRFAQWALDETAHDLPPGRVSAERLREMARGLVAVAGLLAARADTMDRDRDGSQ